MGIEMAKVDEIIDKYAANRHALISLLLDVQDKFFYLPQEALQRVADKVGMPAVQVYQVARFYKAFSLKPKGKYPIAVCTGTACHVQGAIKIMEQIERELHIKEGETTPDKKFSVESVRCLGCCGLAPVVTVGKNLHGRIPTSKVSKILKQYE